MSSHQSTSTHPVEPQRIAPEPFSRCAYCQGDLHPSQAAYCTRWCNQQARAETKRLTALQKHLSKGTLTNHTLTLYRSTTGTLERYQHANRTYLRAGAQRQLQQEPTAA